MKKALIHSALTVSIMAASSVALASEWVSTVNTDGGGKFENTKTNENLVLNKDGSVSFFSNDAQKESVGTIHVTAAGKYIMTFDNGQVIEATGNGQTDESGNSFVDMTDRYDSVTVDGANGLDGANGTDGSNGLDGTNGTDGNHGADGVDGSNGNDGLDGTNGTDGAHGTDGVDGSNGNDGLDGTNGTDGDHGTDGVDGSNGNDGLDGSDGLDADMSIVDSNTDKIAANEQAQNSVDNKHSSDIKTNTQNIFNNKMAIDNLYGEINRLDDRIDSVMASTHAINNARPYLSGVGKTAVGVGVGYADGESAVAIGAAHSFSETLSASFTINATTGSNTDVSAGAGLQYQF